MSLIYSDYKFGIYSNESTNYKGEQKDFSLKYSSGIRDIGFKYDIDYFPNPQHALNWLKRIPTLALNQALGFQVSSI